MKRNTLITSALRMSSLVGSTQYEKIGAVADALAKAKNMRLFIKNIIKINRFEIIRYLKESKITLK